MARVPDVTPPAADARDAPGRVRVFGVLLATDRALPGLPIAPPGDDGQFPFWQLVTTDRAVPCHSATARRLGALTYGNGTIVTLGVGTDGAEIVIGDTGRFTITDSRIEHAAPFGVDRGAVALDLIGIVLPYALHAGGAWCMHASAVQMPAGVIAFVAARGTGKSTLAAHCVQDGAPLVADDVVVIRQLEGVATVTPSGVPLRLRAETARAVGVAATVVDDWGKVRVEAPLADRVMPIAAIYVLTAAAPDATIERAARTTRAAALALLTNGKITELLGGDAAGDALSRCITLSRAAPVFDLSVPRDLARLGEVTAALRAWHATPADVPERA
ncbi:MAG TPA: hypothetical protein VE861_06165 [Gemmatimonadaceae bacterium]|nr:hypothetical protein [Gemmatimonadaceae bacterium]